MKQWNLQEVFAARCSKCGEDCQYAGSTEEFAVANAKSDGWKLKNDEPWCRACLEEDVKLCSECEEPIKPEDDTCVECAWKLKNL